MINQVFLEYPWMITVTSRPKDSMREFEDCSDEAEEICRCPQEGPRASEGLTDDKNPLV